MIIFFFRQKKLKASVGEEDEEHTDMSSMVLLSVCPSLCHSAPSSTQVPGGTFGTEPGRRCPFRTSGLERDGSKDSITGEGEIN